MQPDDLQKQLKALEKENKLLSKKLSLCNAQREDTEIVMNQTRLLLENVLKEETLSQLNMFRRFVPQEFLTTLNKKSIIDIYLGDHVEREMTILFSDIRSFTKLSESMSPEDNFNFINAYLKYIEPGIYKNHGFIDKYIGDAIMALFYSADDAIQAGIDMLVALYEYNKKRIKKSYVPIQIGIGLHTGSTMIGIIGVEQRMQSTVISDAVNAASRIESLTKYFDAVLLVSGVTVQKVPKDKYRSRFLGKVKVVGKNEDLSIFEIIDAETPEVAELKMSSAPFLEKGLDLFFKRKFAEASVEFTNALGKYPNDKAAMLYLKLCADYMINRPPENWDATAIFQSK